MAHNPRPGTRRGGGVAVIYRETIRYKPFSTTSFTTFEHIDLTLSHVSSHLRVIVIYRPPATSFADFINDFASLLELVILSPGRLVILGDFNIHVDHDQDKHRQKFLDTLDSFNLNQHVSEATHTSGHILDLVITRSSDDFINVFVDQPQLSDHHSICFRLNLSKPPLPTKILHYRKIKSIDREEFISDLKTSHFMRQEYNDVNELTNAYNETLSNLLDRHAPLKSKTVTIHPTSPWYTPEIHEAKKIKRKAERTWRRTRLTVHREIFITERNNVNKHISKSKQDFYSNTIKESSNIQRDLYTCVNTLFNKNVPSKLPDSENDDDLCQSMVKFFSEKVEKIENLLKEVQSNTTLNCCSDTFLPETVKNKEKSTLQSFHPVTEEDIRKHITSSASKSCIIDPIPTYLIKECLHTLLPIVTSIINCDTTSEKRHARSKQS